MFGRRRRKAVVADVPDQWPVCGQVYLFNREAEREARERAAAPPTDDVDEQEPPGQP